jgi:putative Holliday junction resolvase
MNTSERRGRVLGIDFGTKRIGVAVSDPLRIIAQGVGTLENNAEVVDGICRIVREREVGLVVVGMPYAPDGGLGAKGKEVQEFVNRLQGSVRVPVETWDESYSSREAQRAFIAGGMKRKRRQEKGRVDEMAARLLLQEYLDSYEH